mmetsp:Transcript_4711/g.10381  ORF Transcript_4711/g.10381 Transcript_4711/m.10381 type:complete len:303 (-) Transcript_4711:1360-2268(-)
MFSTRSSSSCPRAAGSVPDSCVSWSSSSVSKVSWPTLAGSVPAKASPRKSNTSNEDRASMESGSTRLRWLFPPSLRTRILVQVSNGGNDPLRLLPERSKTSKDTNPASDGSRPKNPESLAVRWVSCSNSLIQPGRDALTSFPSMCIFLKVVFRLPQESGRDPWKRRGSSSRFQPSGLERSSSSSRERSPIQLGHKPTTPVLPRSSLRNNVRFRKSSGMRTSKRRSKKLPSYTPTRCNTSSSNGSAAQQTGSANGVATYVNVTGAPNPPDVSKTSPGKMLLKWSFFSAGRVGQKDATSISTTA